MTPSTPGLPAEPYRFKRMWMLHSLPHQDLLEVLVDLLGRFDPLHLEDPTIKQINEMVGREMKRCPYINTSRSREAEGTRLTSGPILTICPGQTLRALATLKVK